MLYVKNLKMVYIIGLISGIVNKSKHEIKAPDKTNSLFKVKLNLHCQLW